MADIATSPEQDQKAAAQAKFASEVANGVSGALEPVLLKLTEGLSGIAEIVAAQKAPVFRANPNEQGYDDVPAPSGNSLYTPPAKGEEGLRMARVMRALACGKHYQEVPRILADKYGDKSTSKLMEKTLATTTPSEGGALVVDQYLVNEFFGVLREEFMLEEIGARRIPMPGGAVTIPGMASGSSFTWVDETEAPTPSTPGFESVHMSSKKARAKVVISNDLREESSVDVDRMVLADMVAVMKEGLTAAALMSNGSVKSPKGVKHNARRNTVSIGAVTPDSPTTLVKKLMNSKVVADPRFCSHVFNPDLWAFLYNLKTNTGDYHFREEMDKGLLGGFRFRTTVQIPTAANITDWFFGDWRELLIGDTKFMEFLIDPWSGVDAGTTALHLIHKTDFALRQGLAIAHSDDADIT